MRRAITTLSLTLAVVLSLPLTAETSTRHDLFRVPLTVQASSQPPRAAHIRRSRFTDVALGPLARRLATRDVKAAAPIALALDLFDGETLPVRIQTVTAGSGETQIFEGAVEGDPASAVVLTVSNGHLFGNVRTRDRWYQIRPAAGAQHTIVEMDAGALGESLEPLQENVPRVSSNSITSTSDDGSIIDILVMYTPNTKTYLGQTALASLIDTAIAETNTAYQNSGVRQRLRLVHSAETANWLDRDVTVNADSDIYSFNDVLVMLRNMTDGKMDEVHGLRDRYGADAVVLLVDRGGSCGVAYNNSHEGNAFAVVQWDCATGNFSFGHELGHNMGLQHERTTAGTAYAYGWADPTGAFRTMMAIGCGPFSCGRIQHFSNPDILFGGLPTGAPLDSITPANAALALNEGALAFSNFRASVTTSCSYSIDPMTTSVGSGAISGTARVTAPAGCNWSAVSASGFLTITGGTSGSGNGVVSYSVAANGGAARSGTLQIAGHNFVVRQGAAGVRSRRRRAASHAPRGARLTSPAPEASEPQR